MSVRTLDSPTKYTASAMRRVFALLVVTVATTSALTAVGEASAWQLECLPGTHSRSSLGRKACANKCEYAAS